jgi:hypothetical protein
MQSDDQTSKYDINLDKTQGALIGDHGTQTNIFQLFSAAAPPLSSQIRIREFETLVNERTKNFIGRDFIFDAIAEVMRSQDLHSGYIVIRGEPGVGKTAIVAELVRRGSCAHHFNIASQNIRSPKEFLSNICAQLIVKYDLPYSVLPLHATSDSGFLSQLLAEIATKNSAEPTLILLDAIDEADNTTLSPGVNPLYLPPVLPPGIFFLLTSREEQDPRLVVDHEKAIYLREDDPQNERDVEVYIMNFIKTHLGQMTERIAEWGVPQAEFVEVLKSRSEGNFMYLVYVLSDIRDGLLNKLSIDGIRNLPKGLKSYYQRHWRMMKAQDSERFEKYYEPVVCQLAVVREPVSIGQLEEWTQLPSMRISEVIASWRQFLNEDSGSDGQPVFRIYHKSFQDFLREEVGLKPFHERIVEAALKKMAGFRAAQ